MIDNLQSQMTHTNIVDIRETKAKMGVDVLHVFLNRVYLTTDISGRFLDRKQKLIR